MPGVHIVHRFPEVSSFSMLQQHGHTLDFRPGPRIPYQTCVNQAVPVSQLDHDALSTPARPSCQIISALPCHAVSHGPYPITCTYCSTQRVGCTGIAKQKTTVSQVNDRSDHQGGTKQHSWPAKYMPCSPPPPTRKSHLTRKRKASSEDKVHLCSSKLIKNENMSKIEFRPLLPNTDKRPAFYSTVHRNMVNKQQGNRLKVQPSSSNGSSDKVVSNIIKGDPYQFELNIPFPQRPKEKITTRFIDLDSLPRKSKFGMSDHYQKTWPTEPAPKQGYISVLEQAINHLSKRCIEDPVHTDSQSNTDTAEADKPQDGFMAPEMTKESLDQAWLQVLNKVFGKHDKLRPAPKTNGSSSSSSSCYPSEISELDSTCTTSAFESDYISGTEQDIAWSKASGTDSDELKELLPQNFRLPPEITKSTKQVHQQSDLMSSKLVRYDTLDRNGDHDYSKPDGHLEQESGNKMHIRTYTYNDEHGIRVLDPKSKPFRSINLVNQFQVLGNRTQGATDKSYINNNYTGFDQQTGLENNIQDDDTEELYQQQNPKKDDLGDDDEVDHQKIVVKKRNVNSQDDEDDDDDVSDEDDIRDEHEEEKATDADVETEFTSSAEHEAPKYVFLKPRMQKRSVLQNSRTQPKVYKNDHGTPKGFLTPTYQCNFPTSSDSEGPPQGNLTPSQTRKPQPPFKSPEPVDPSFRGVTVQIRTKVEENRVQLSIKGFFNCRKKPKQMLEYSGSHNAKSSSDSDSTSTSDLYQKRKRRSYHSGKQCASCCTKKTPLWRDAEDGTPLCNACGIRYKKYKIKCHSCWNIPRKDLKMNSTCVNCGEVLRLSAMRNPAKFWT